jgi:hypothetical protein
LILACGLIYIFTTNNFTLPEFWIKAIIDCKKGKEDGLGPNKMFSNIAFIDTAGASNIFGAYFGIMIDSMYLKGTPCDINSTSFLKSLGRVLISILCISPLALPYFLVSDFAPIMIVYLFKRTVPFFTVMLILFSVAKLAHIKLGLVNTTNMRF